MPIYRKKPSLVEARQVTADNREHVAIWCDGDSYKQTEAYQAWIQVGEQEAEHGDWIVKEANGSFNVYTDEAFRLMHEVD